MQDRMYINGMEINDERTNVFETGTLIMTFRVPCDECESDGFNVVLKDDRVVCEACFEMLLQNTKKRMKRRIEM